MYIVLNKCINFTKFATDVAEEKDVSEKPKHDEEEEEKKTEDKEEEEGAWTNYWIAVVLEGISLLSIIFLIYKNWIIEKIYFL